MGNINIINGASFPNTIPKIPLIDGMEAPGSLLLVEPGHSAKKWSGIPITKSTVPNLLRANANKVTAVNTDEPVLTWSSLNDSTKSVIRRTSKGGVYIMNKPTATVYTDSMFTVSIPNEIADYVMRNFANRLFVSVWIRTVEPRTATIAKDAVSVMNLQAETVFGPQLNNVNYRYSSLYRPIGFAEAVGNYRLNAEFNDLRTFAPKTAPFFKQTAFQAGNTMSGSVSNPGNTGSYVFYRTYMEDLTVSNRSYAEADAMDSALYSQAFGIGGRYYNDVV